MRALFIYWKVAPEQASAALAAVRAFQAQWRQRHPSLQAGLYQRAETGTEWVTLMETYAHPGGLDADVELETVLQAQTTLSNWCQGLRHVEQFDLLQP